MTRERQLIPATSILHSNISRLITKETKEALDFYFLLDLPVLTLGDLIDPTQIIEKPLLSPKLLVSQLLFISS